MDICKEICGFEELARADGVLSAKGEDRGVIGQGLVGS